MIVLVNGDSIGYYAYLPAALIYNDLDNLAYSTQKRLINAKQMHWRDRPAADIPQDLRTGIPVGKNQIITYTYGIALMQSPFFIAAHLIAKPLGYEADGFSLPYRLLVLLANLFYVSLGLFALRRILLRYTDDNAVSVTLIIVALITNLYFFTVLSGYMSHSYLFFLYAILIEKTIKWYETYQRRDLFIIAFLCGFIALIRPVELLVVIIPIAYKITNWQSLKARFQIFKKQALNIFLALFIGILPIIPQLFYWKYVTNHWIYNSYGFNYKFDFSNPRFPEGWISFLNGWLIYTPVMVFALIGLLFLFKKRDFLLPIALFLPIYVFVIYSWWCWNYINGFGSRPMIEVYPLLAIPLSMLVHFLLKNRFVTGIFSSLLIFLMWLNMFQTWQMSESIMISEAGNWAYYKAIFGKTSLNYNRLVAFDSDAVQPDEDRQVIKTIFSNDFESSADKHHVRVPAHTSMFVYEIAPQQFYISPHYKPKEMLDKGRWLKVSADFYCIGSDFYNLWNKTSMTIRFSKNGTPLKDFPVRIENKIGNSTKIFAGDTHKWGHIKLYVPLSDVYRNCDDVEAYIWNPSPTSVFMDNFRFEVCD